GKRESFGDVVDIGQNLWLRGVTFAPAPVALQLLVERVGVVDAFHVTTSAGVAVPVPGATDSRTGFEAQHIPPALSRCMHCVQARKPRADHQDVADVLARVRPHLLSLSDRDTGGRCPRSLTPTSGAVVRSVVTCWCSPRRRRTRNRCSKRIPPR